MPLQCNIDSRGKRARFITGMLCLLVGIALGIAAYGLRSRPLAIVAGVIAFSGGFAIFEARAGWCALRAMGLRTKI